MLVKIIYEECHIQNIAATVMIDIAANASVCASYIVGADQVLTDIIEWSTRGADIDRIVSIGGIAKNRIEKDSGKRTGKK